MHAHWRRVDARYSLLTCLFGPAFRTCFSTLKIYEPSRLTIGGLTIVPTSVPKRGGPRPIFNRTQASPWTCDRVSHQLLFCLARFSARLHFGARTCLSTLKFSEPSRLTIGHLTRQRARTGNELLRNPRNLSATSAGPLRGTLRMTGHRAMRIGKRSHYMLHVGTPPTDVALHGQLDLTQWSQRFPIVIPSGLFHAVHVHPWPRLGCSPWESRCPHERNVPPRTRTWNLRLGRPTPYPGGQRTN